ncbi:MAG: hypothetical protein HZA91_03775 [Verrucomicrobia bacterium]|nr:hypothetical protein [Verrucomicrobiota bacterium]
MLHFLRTAGPPFAGMMQLVPYEDVFRRRSWTLGTFLFADIERLAPMEAEALARVWDCLAARGCRLLNHPTRSMRRYELLRTLQETGVNPHDIYRLGERRMPRRYPVFIRDENEHGRVWNDLIADEAALRRAFEELSASGARREDCVAVEFEETKDPDGLYRKYAAFRVGGAIVPRHVFFSREWMVRHSDALTPGQIEEERRYIETNPHEGELRRIFELARTDYGRIDYSLKDGRIIVWEINTHPTILWPDAEDDPRRKPHHAMFLERFAQAMTAVDTADPARVRLPMMSPETPQPGSARAALHRLVSATVPLGIRQRVAARARRR